MSRLSRRKRLIFLTAATGLVFLGAVALIISLLSGTRPYRPGEKIEGVVADLDRRLPPDYPKVTFADASKAAGIEFRHFSGQRSTQLPEDMGSGAAWGDYDNDGWPDLLIVNMVGPLTLSEQEAALSPAHCALYHNNRDGTFREVSAQAGVDFRGWGMAAAWGDADRDGWIDLFVSSYGENRFYHNERDGTFRDKTAESGLGGIKGFWAGASWADFNRDGFLDLFVCGYVKYKDLGNSGTSLQFDVEVPASINPSAFEPERNLLYKNNGDGTFREMALLAGVAGQNGKSLSAAWCDFDDDGWPDLYVANDVSDNIFLHNLGEELFEEISHSALVADYRGAMGIAVGDWDRDEDMDIFITHWIAQENALYVNKYTEFSRQNPSSKLIRFMDEADRVGLGQIALDYIGWGTAFFDYDNDGRLDLFVTNGSTFQQKQNPRLLIPMRDLLFWNAGADEGFFDVSPVSGEIFNASHVGRGAAVADYDNDGDIDIFVINHNGPGILLKNQGGSRKNWLKVHLTGRESNPQAIGAKLRLVTQEHIQTRQVGAQSSYLSQNSLVEHFGLGQQSQVDTLEIIWPNGLRQVFQALTTNQTIKITEGQNIQPEDNAINPEDKNRTRQFWKTYRRAGKQRLAGELEEAYKSYDRALQFNPQHENTLYYFGSISLALGKYTEAENVWKQLLRINPSNSRAHYQLGDLYLNYEQENFFDVRKAESEYLSALRINKEDSRAQLRLGHVALIDGNLQLAGQRFDAVIGSNYKSVEAYFLGGYVAWEQGDSEKALAMLQSAYRNSRPSQETEAFPGEGDTRPGGLFEQLEPSMRKSLFHAYFANLAELEEAEISASLIEEKYRELKAFLMKVRKIDRFRNAEPS